MTSLRLVCPSFAAAAAALLLLAAFPTAWATTLDEFQALPDSHVEVRRSLGVRSVRAPDADHLEVVIGMSVTDAARKADAYRIMSPDDAAYAFEQFVRPTGAEARVENELKGVEGSPFGDFHR